MRTTTHHGRAKGNVGYSAKHNDRNFDLEKADNIDANLAAQNIYVNCYADETLTFEEVELRAYNQLFGEQLKQTNEKYIKNGHPERCKTMEEWKSVRQNAPEESIYQIGNIDAHVDGATLWECYKDYDARLRVWNREHGYPFVIMTKALHVDEAVPHIHSRRVWLYQDESGMRRIGQEKALERAGVPLPNPDKPQGRHNNRKMVFDAEMRTLWLDVLAEHGINAERIPVPDGKHNRDKEEMVRDKYQAMQDAAADLETVLGMIEESWDKYADTLESVKNAEISLQTVEGKVEVAKEVLEGLEGEKKALEGDVAAYRDMKIAITDLTTAVKELPRGYVKMQKSDYELLSEQSKAYICNRDRIERIDTVEARLTDVEKAYDSLCIKYDNLTIAHANTKRSLATIETANEQYREENALLRQKLAIAEPLAEAYLRLKGYFEALQDKLNSFVSAFIDLFVKREPQEKVAEKYADLVEEVTEKSQNIEQEVARNEEQRYILSLVDKLNEVRERMHERRNDTDYLYSQAEADEKLAEDYSDLILSYGVDPDYEEVIDQMRENVEFFERDNAPYLERYRAQEREKERERERQREQERQRQKEEEKKREQERAYGE